MLLTTVTWLVYLQYWTLHMCLILITLPSPSQSVRTTNPHLPSVCLASNARLGRDMLNLAADSAGIVKVTHLSQFELTGI